jgi:hypothetical protein
VFFEKSIEGVNYTKNFTLDKNILTLTIKYKTSLLLDSISIFVPEGTQLMGECASEFEAYEFFLFNTTIGPLYIKE